MNRLEFKQVVDIKIELERWKTEELKAYPKFREKEALLNVSIEKLTIKAAQKIAEECQNLSAFEIKYQYLTHGIRKAQERNKLLESQLDKLKADSEASKLTYEQRLEDLTRLKYPIP